MKTMDNIQKIVLPSRPREEGGLLTLSTSHLSGPSTAPHPQPSSVLTTSQKSLPLETPRDALMILKSKPSLDDLERCLEYLEEPHDDSSGTGQGERFHVRLLGPIASQIVFVLVNDIVPAYWPTLSTDTALRKQWRTLIRCLKSVAGIGAASTRLKALCRPSSSLASSDGKPGLNAESGTVEHLQTALQLLECILNGDKTVHSIWSDIVQYETRALRRPMVMDQLTSFLAGGSVLSAAAEAVTTLAAKSKNVGESSWLGEGRQYALWLGRNIHHWSQKITEADDVAAGKARDRLLSRALSLGYTEQIVSTLFGELLVGHPDDLRLCRAMLTGLTSSSQSLMLNSLLKILSDKAPGYVSSKYIGGTAALLHQLVDRQENLTQCLVRWLTDTSGGNVSCSLQLIRAVITCIGQDLELLKQAHTSCLGRFGSKMNIKQDPIMQQERTTQVFLLLTARLHKTNPAAVKEMRLSSDYLNAISNRLAATSNRAQFLGMVVGTAVSDVADATGKKLNFDSAEVRGEDGEFYKGLLKTDDSIGSIADLAKVQASESQQSSQPIQHARPKSKPAPKSAPTRTPGVKPKIIAIDELSSDDSSEDDLPTYAKPDSDASDSDEDPTLINRNKAKAPVYIRDLLAGLSDRENHDRHRLAIETAPALIRRKTSFGTEVSEHVEELAVAIIGLKDVNLGIEDDDEDANTRRSNELRLQAMVAVIVAQPDRMAPWFANTFFNGDYSTAQRSAILAALTLAARELAGLGEEDKDLTAADTAPKFPSKRLPAKAEGMFLSTSAPSSSRSRSPSSSTTTAPPSAASLPLMRLSGRLERSILQPLALSAADAATGPKALKVRTFSSRLDPARQAARTRTVPNKLAGLVAAAFFYPLTARWRSLLGARAHASAFSASLLLGQLVRSLALILAAAGPGTLSLPGTTAEFWALLLGLRGQAAAVVGPPDGDGGGTESGSGGGGGLAVVEALLFGFLTLLELNADRPADVARDHAHDMAEMRDWVARVFENVRGGGAGGAGGAGAGGAGAGSAAANEEDKVRMLAAGVMVKADELVDAYRRQLLGSAGAATEML